MAAMSREKALEIAVNEVSQSMGEYLITSQNPKNDAQTMIRKKQAREKGLECQNAVFILKELLKENRGK